MGFVIPSYILRGNQCPGGSGSVLLLRVDRGLDGAEIVWIASMSYQHRTATTNFAEYWGL
uniref:Uncharacterized protein n=1 Tax=Globisporangium ultimum (strain ATCC 200006 / CBS 805.95 / DAOM BR144) TaxID=431595 RepID=K3W5W3_GLOUD